MATQVQLRRGTAAENNAFTGAQGEVTVDTTNDTLRVHDGSQAGGYEIAKSDSQAHTNIDINSGSIDGTTIGGSTPAAGSFTGLTLTGDATFGDQDKAIFGAGSDLQIFHDGSHSFIQDKGTGDLFVDGDNNLTFRSGDGLATKAKFTTLGACELYHNNSQKLATTSSGIDVTGTVTADGLTVQGTSGTYPTTEIRHSLSNVEGEFLRIARTDSPSIRYHSISAFHEATAVTNYIQFDIHDATTTTSQTTALKIYGNGNLQFDSGYGSAATAYGCRAWVNFDGTGTVSIREDGNVSSITDRGTGLYTVNFTTAMPDINYCAVPSGNPTTGGAYTSSVIIDGTGGTTGTTTTACQIRVHLGTGSSWDPEIVTLAIFR